MSLATSQFICEGCVLKSNLSHHFLTESVKKEQETPRIAVENRRLKLRSHSDSQAFDTYNEWLVIIMGEI